MQTSPKWRTSEHGELFREIDITLLQGVVDPRMAYIADRGLVNALGLGWYESVDADVAGMKRFARYIVARYGSYPVVWTLGGEVAGYDPDHRHARIDVGERSHSPSATKTPTATPVPHTLLLNDP